MEIELIRLGEKCAREKNYSKAIMYYEKALEFFPNHEILNRKIAMLAMQNQEYDKAHLYWDRILSSDAYDKAALFYKGTLFLLASRLKEASEYFYEVLKIDKNHVQSLTNLGVIALREKQDMRAIECFTQALIEDNESIEARNNLAATFMHHDLFENAITHYTILLKKDAYNIEYLYNSAVSNMSLGQLKLACQQFNLILKQTNHHPSLSNLASIHIRLKKTKKAIFFLKKALKIKPLDRVNKYMLEALTNTGTFNVAPFEYIQNLFNNYASYYEKHLQSLNYKIPLHILNAINTLPKFSNVLDLGCGTGLVGETIKNKYENITGVDLAAKMLKEAKAKKVYTKLVEADIFNYLQEDQTYYDCIIAADVLPYWGDLSVLFSLIKQRLCPEGYFIFSTEITDVAPFILQQNARFAHSLVGLEKLIEQLSFKIYYRQEVIARTQEEIPVKVLLHILHKS